MRMLKITVIILTLLLLPQCSDNRITNIEFTSTDHSVSKLSNEIIFMIAIIPENEFYSFSDDPSRLNCEGDNCNSYLVKSLEMQKLIIKLSDTKYFPWEFMSAVTPYPEEDCNLLIFGKDSDGNLLDYMCTIGRGKNTYKILFELSETFSGDARSALMNLAHYYQN